MTGCADAYESLASPMKGRTRRNSATERLPSSASIGELQSQTKAAFLQQMRGFAKRALISQQREEGELSLGATFTVKNAHHEY